MAVNCNLDTLFKNTLENDNGIYFAHTPTTQTQPKQIRWKVRSVRRSAPERVVVQPDEPWNLKTWMLDPGSFQGSEPSSKCMGHRSSGGSKGVVSLCLCHFYFPESRKV